MAASATIQPAHPTTSFFGKPPTFPEDYQPSSLREGAMGPHRAHPYQRERSQSPLRKGIDYRSTRVLDPIASFHQSRPLSRGSTSMHSSRSMPHHFSSSPRHNMASSDSTRIGVDQLVDGFSPSRPLGGHRDAYTGSPIPPSGSSLRGPGEYSEHARLPGIGSVRSLSVQSIHSNVLTELVAAQYKTRASKI